jgi:hypothetical protein
MLWNVLKLDTFLQIRTSLLYKHWAQFALLFNFLHRSWCASQDPEEPVSWKSQYCLWKKLTQQTFRRDGKKMWCVLWLFASVYIFWFPEFASSGPHSYASCVCTSTQTLSYPNVFVHFKQRAGNCNIKNNKFYDPPDWKLLPRAGSNSLKRREVVGSACA